MHHVVSARTRMQSKRRGFIFVSGQLGIDPFTGMLVPGGTEAETEEVLRNIQEILAAADSAFSKVVKATVFLTDMASTYFANQFRLALARHAKVLQTGQTHRQQ